LTEDDYLYVGRRVYPYILGFAALTGIRTVIVSEAGISGSVPQAILVDVATNSGRNNVEYWRSILKVALKDGLSPSPLRSLDFWAQADVTSEELERANATGQPCTAFEELPNVAAALGTKRRVYSLYDTPEPMEVVTPLTGADRRTRRVLGEKVLAMPTLRDVVRLEKKRAERRS
jgi:hypothetical protein